MLKIIILFIKRLLSVIAISGLCGLVWIIYTWVEIRHEHEQNGRAWCENIIDQYESDPKKALSTYSHLSPIKGYQMYLHERSNNGQQLAFSVKEDGSYQCSYTQAASLFPLSHVYSSETGKWEVFD